MNSISNYFFAHIEIEPVGTLAETAGLLGLILGLSFSEDVQRRYDEYPAYISETEGLRYSLLGIPEAIDDLRDNPTCDFELMVEPIMNFSNIANMDISDQLISRIRKDGRLECESLK